MNLLHKSPEICNRCMKPLCDYYVTIELRMCECYQAMTLGEISEKDRHILTLTVMTFHWLNDVTDIHLNALATSASSNKTLSSFHLFRCLFAIKSANNA